VSGVYGHGAMVARRRCRHDKRLPPERAPDSLKDYAARFAELFATLAQRQAFRRYLEGLLLPTERNSRPPGSLL
jgi:hypothetical protein